MLTSVFEAFIKGPVPAVQVDELMRGWSFLNEEARASRLKGGTAVNIKLLADRCSPNANVPAVFVRAALIDALLQQGRLDRWREGNGLVEKVFEVAATFALPRGLENVDLNALVAAMRARRKGRA
jgi:hypothetical protein